MNKLLKLASLGMIFFSVSTLAHEGRTDPRGGHNCEPLNAKKGLCKGYHKHVKNEVDTDESLNTGQFDYSQKSDYITYNNYLKYKMLKETIGKKVVYSIVLMKRQTDREIARFSKFFLETKKEQIALNLYLQEQSTVDDKVLIDADKERSEEDLSLENKTPWAVFKENKLTINGLSLFAYKSLKFKSANLDQKKIVSWIFDGNKTKYEVYEKDGHHTLVSITATTVSQDKVILTTFRDKTRVETDEMMNNGDYYLFGGVGINVVEYWKDKKKVYSHKKIKERF